MPRSSTTSPRRPRFSAKFALLKSELCRIRFLPTYNERSHKLVPMPYPAYPNGDAVTPYLLDFYAEMYEWEKPRCLCGHLPGRSSHPCQIKIPESDKSLNKGHPVLICSHFLCPMFVDLYDLLEENPDLEWRTYPLREADRPSSQITGMARSCSAPPSRAQQRFGSAIRTVSNKDIVVEHSSPSLLAQLSGVSSQFDWQPPFKQASPTCSPYVRGDHPLHAAVPQELCSAPSSSSSSTQNSMSSPPLSQYGARQETRQELGPDDPQPPNCYDHGYLDSLERFWSPPPSINTLAYQVEAPSVNEASRLFGLLDATVDPGVRYTELTRILTRCPFCEKLMSHRALYSPGHACSEYFTTAKVGTKRHYVDLTTP
ncbi:hypothetical protein SCP_1101930 [Sparassis crispa]|uniref:Uncharacterized protein n=1 Tax=Sparassis crispa TaxID=139825 RepID=A0A401GZA9_9APHY|nr:hypothetical protein SCP_1101930 [Sparassis crispa]GBE87516.1 hypothetical protein SCP_1101930 [Sparassis crispa]